MVAAARFLLLSAVLLALPDITAAQPTLASTYQGIEIRFFDAQLEKAFGPFIAKDFLKSTKNTEISDHTATNMKPLSEVETVTMPPVEIPAKNEPPKKGEPLSFAKTIEVQLTPRTSGTWETLEGDMSLWRLRIVSPGAHSLNLGFTKYFMPPGGHLFVYTPDYKTVVGPFTEKDNEEHGQLWTPLLLGDEVVIEVTLPGNRLPMLELKLTAVNHGYQ